MFKFNFIQDDNEDTNEDLKTEKPQTVYYAASEEVYPNNSSTLIKCKLDEIETKSLTLNNLTLKYVSSEFLLNIIKTTQNVAEDCILKAELNHSDLLPAVYEGGLKIWECTYDLLNYLIDNQINFKQKAVLDLGCGSGILGIYALLNGSELWFQDYNKEVLQNITIPNVLLNSTNNTNTKFFSGDWNSFVTLVEEKYPDKRFDYILTSETIYNRDYYTKLSTVFEKLLKKDGVIFLAAKSFYFGVGGGVHLFQDFLIERKTFKCQSCWQSDNGVKREILKLEYLRK